MDQYSSPLLNPHVVGDNTLTVVDPTGFSPVFPFLVFAQRVETQQQAVFTVTSLSGNSFTVAPVAGYGDIPLDAETSIEEVTPNEQLKVLQSLVLLTFDSYGRPLSTGSAPTVAAGAAAGVGATESIGTGSNDIVGKVNITPAGTPANSGVLATVTFNKPWTNAPKNVILSPANAATAAVMADAFVSSITTTTFVISAANAALTASTAYSWNYQVQG